MQRRTNRGLLLVGSLPASPASHLGVRAYIRTAGSRGRGSRCRGRGAAGTQQQGNGGQGGSQCRVLCGSRDFAARQAGRQAARAWCLRLNMQSHHLDTQVNIAAARRRSPLNRPLGKSFCSAVCVRRRPAFSNSCT